MTYRGRPFHPVVKNIDHMVEILCQKAATVTLLKYFIIFYHC